MLGMHCILGVGVAVGLCMLLVMSVRCEVIGLHSPVVDICKLSLENHRISTSHSYLLHHVLITRGVLPQSRGCNIRSLNLLACIQNLL
ncbi:hypothetical protein M011DRAFT_255740 [Sporormia fimetaria CBS 119925]|uniref:Secreted protein n=1 Tax=Sporormia fimetaria CBS 119925 TaxID=1340428 RepID=A0A6A6UWT7_9PLEO|nr:hypothetical protein M011DRAFT_255740 [Sporormia fimetaria CBS 119925]